MADRASRFVDAMIVLRVRVQSLDPDTVIGMKLDGLASPTMNEHERNLAALFEGMDEITVREFLIAAIRKVRANPVNRPSTEKKDLTTIQHELLPMLRARDNAPNVPESPCGFLTDYLGWDHPLVGSERAFTLRPASYAPSGSWLHRQQRSSRIVIAETAAS